MSEGIEVVIKIDVPCYDSDIIQQIVNKLEKPLSELAVEIEGVTNIEASINKKSVMWIKNFPEQNIPF